MENDRRLLAAAIFALAAAYFLTNLYKATPMSVGERVVLAACTSTTPSRVPPFIV
jgi:hypothetical protein